MIITFSGVDGAGKTTQIDILRQWARQQKIPHRYVWSRGGYTPGFLLLKSLLRYLLGRKLPPPGRNKSRETQLGNSKVARVWLTLAILDLCLLYGVYLRILSLRGRLVICDRYIMDTYIDFRRHFPHIPFHRTLIWRLLENLTPKSDVSFLLLTSVESSLARSKAKNEPFPDDEETLRYRYAAYTDTALFSPDHFIRLDGRAPIDELASTIRRLVSTNPRCRTGQYS